MTEATRFLCHSYYNKNHAKKLSWRGNRKLVLTVVEVKFADQEVDRVVHRLEVVRPTFTG